MKFIDKETAKNLCKLGKGKECCRYLMCGKSGLECAKNTPFALIIDKKVRSGVFFAQGDNCEL